MRGNIMQEMLLLDEPSILRLYKEMHDFSLLFVGPFFTIALVLEYLGEMDFLGMLKKLLIVVVFMNCFYEVHTKAVQVSLETASATLRKVSPNNLFLKSWAYSKVKTAKKEGPWAILERLVVPDINDLIASGLFVCAKGFTWLLRLIFSTVYHLSYVFSGLTALLYFLGWTKDAIKGTVQASFWCIVMPFVVVTILALVGNSVQDRVAAGQLAVSSIDSLVWLFGVTLMLLVSPAIAFGMVRGDGVHAFAPKMGGLLLSAGNTVMNTGRLIKAQGERAFKAIERSKFSPGFKALSAPKEKGPRLPMVDHKKLSGAAGSTPQAGNPGAATPVNQTSGPKLTAPGKTPSASPAGPSGQTHRSVPERLGTQGKSSVPTGNRGKIGSTPRSPHQVLNKQHVGPKAAQAAPNPHRRQTVPEKAHQAGPRGPYPSRGAGPKSLGPKNQSRTPTPHGSNKKGPPTRPTRRRDELR